jgi:predicted PurR-regulated permease PerM
VAEIQSDIARSVLAVLFILALIGSTIRILRPFLGAIVWATTVIVATWSFMISLQAVLWNKRSLAVVVMSLLLLCVLVVPLSFAIAASYPLSMILRAGPKTWRRLSWRRHRFGQQVLRWLARKPPSYGTASPPQEFRMRQLGSRHMRVA